MQPIERVGVFALLFLVVTVVAVVLWDKNPEEPGKTSVARRDSTSTPAQAGPARTKSTPPQLEERAPIRTSSTRGSRGSRGPAANQALPTSGEPKALVPAPRKRTKPRASRSPATTTRSSPSGPAGPGGASSSAGVKPASTVLIPKPARETASPGPASKGSTEKKPKSSPRKSDGPVVHVVRSGDTLGEISLAYLGTSKRWKEIAQLNGVDAARLRLGQELVLPVDAEASGSTRSKASGTTTKPAGKTAVAGGEYSVKSGDNLWLIAQRQLGDGERWSEIRDLNPSLDADRLKVGQVLLLPGGVSSPARASSAPIAKRSSASTARGGMVR